jgi:hypothetical protein
MSVLSANAIERNLKPPVLNGPGKFDRIGSVTAEGARAAYALVSKNDNTSHASVNWLDENLGPVGVWSSYSSGPGYDSVMNFYNSVFSTHQNIMEYWSSTASSSSNISTYNYANATNSNGEFCNSMIDVWDYRTITSPHRNGTDWQEKHRLNNYAISSSHTDNSIVYILNNGKLRGVDRCVGVVLASKENTLPLNLTTIASTITNAENINAAMCGSADYNNVRKELVYLSYVSSGVFNITTLSGFDLDAYPSPKAAALANGVTATTATLTIPNWDVNNNESQYGLHPIVANNGNVYISVMFSCSNHRLYSVTRNGSTAITATLLQSLSLTTSYGREQGIHYGRRQITSQDNSAVFSFCPYYYYGSGCVGFMISRNKYYQSVSITDSTYGYSIMPYKKNGFVIYYCGNFYASSPTGGYFHSTWIQEDNTWIYQGSSIYPCVQVYPNTTNYPVICAVTNYKLMDIWK